MSSQPAREVLKTGRGDGIIITVDNGETETKEQTITTPFLRFFFYRNALTSQLAIGCKMSLRQVLIHTPTRNAKNFVANGCGVENSRGEVITCCNFSYLQADLLLLFRDFFCMRGKRQKVKRRRSNDKLNQVTAV